MHDNAVTLLPLPDSPTIPRTFPFSTEKLTSLTAFTSPRWVKKDAVAKVMTELKTRIKELDNYN